MKRRNQTGWQMTLTERAPALPVWASLPEACRREVVELLVQLLLQHREDPRFEIGLASAEAADE